MTYRKPCERQANVGHTLNRTSYGSASAPAAAIHQRGSFFRSRSAAASASDFRWNTAKQAEPDPDIRASRQPSVARSAESTSPISGAIAIAGGSRSLRQDKSRSRYQRRTVRLADRRAEDSRDEQACENVGSRDRAAGPYQPLAAPASHRGAISPRPLRRREAHGQRGTSAHPLLFSARSLEALRARVSDPCSAFSARKHRRRIR